MSQPANDDFSQHLSDGEESTEDANHKFLRSLPSAWSNLAMTMRTNPEIDNLSIDDLYNNLRVFEQEIQGVSKTSSSAQNVAFVSQSKSSTNKVKSGFSGAYSTCTPSTSSTNAPEKEVLAGFADEVIYSLFAKQTEDLDLLHEDLEQIDDVDIEEMDINWQIAMIAIRMKKFYKKTGRRVRVDGKTPVGFDKKKLECFNCHNTGHFARECTANRVQDGKKKSDSPHQHQEAGKQEKNQMGLLIMDDGIVNWGEHTEAEEINHALMAISSSNEGPQEPEPNVSDDRSSEFSTCQSNDSAGSIGTSSVHSVGSESEISSVPPEVYVSSPITTNEKGVSVPQIQELNLDLDNKLPKQDLKTALILKDKGHMAGNEGSTGRILKNSVGGSVSSLILARNNMELQMLRQCQAHHHVAPSQPSSSTILVSSPSSLTRQMTLDDLLQVVPQLMKRVDGLEKGAQANQADNGECYCEGWSKKVKKLLKLYPGLPISKAKVIDRDGGKETQGNEGEGKSSYVIEDAPKKGLMVLEIVLKDLVKNSNQWTSKKTKVVMKRKKMSPTRGPERGEIQMARNKITLQTWIRIFWIDSRIKLVKHDDYASEDEAEEALWGYFKEYLSAEVCKAMLDKKLQGGKPDEDCYKLLKWMEKQAGIRK
ncbi:ribonuclease H-like domain-containing protein [Tanacetum coccineum]